MRILLTTDPIGGVWTFTRELTHQLLSARHAVALVSFGRELSSGQRAWTEQMAVRYPTNFVFRAGDAPLEWMQDNGDAFSGGANLLLETAHWFGADLLHANQFCWGALPGKLPRIVTAHSDVMSSWASCCNPAALESSTWLARYRDLVQRGLGGADMVVAPTAWMERALKRNFEVPCESTVIYNGRTVPAGGNDPERKLQAVCVGRLWDEAKGLKTLLGIELPFPILVAGELSFDRASVSTGLLQPLGHSDEAALFDLFRSSSIYVATSIYEPFGLAPLEAALCGCALVAHDIPPMREVWGDSALFYSTEEELSTLLRRLRNNAQMLEAARRKAHKRARQFSAQRMGREYMAAYQSIVMRPSGTAPRAQETSQHAA